MDVNGGRMGVQPPLSRDEAEGIAWLMILAAHVLVIVIAVIVVVSKNWRGATATGVLEIALYSYTCWFLRGLKRRLP